MALQLYRKGDTHNVRGIECELVNIRHDQVDEYLAQGWVRDPKEIDEPEKPDNVVELKKTDPKHPVRQKAKEAGIDGWKTRSISKLEAELDGAEE